ncbi:MAG: sigma-54-dependent Fis family transcriptional regulator [Ignavibacteria bacterium]|nr:sigma-54-dependent Fis family transcriptional regulator [Ignavibacteria bacterium]MBI3766048.1 sigma-54-dependent Fis family transcriptional regulator [Ignavibacteriales bacterium]
MVSNTVLFLSLNGDSSSHLAEKLRGADITVREASSFFQAQEDLLSQKCQTFVVRCDATCETISDALQFIRTHNLETKLIISGKSGSIEDAVRLIKGGATDFLTGDCTDARLVESILKTVTNYRETVPKSSPLGSVHASETDSVLVGQSSAICEIRSAVNLVAKSQTTVLITGESGTGKEVVARLIHLQSSRVNKQFIALNCATLPKDVIENELFGHEKGAFTGALLKKAGCFELANGGTLLFDEIAEMSLETQAKLLRAIETQKFRRLGGKDEVTVDVRMIAATNKNISTALKSKELREDLYYRLSVIEIFIPPLRERKEDIPLLIEYFLSLFSVKYAKPHQHFTDECLEMLGSYDWPGNVREIRNVVERAVVICPHEFIGPQFIPERIQRQLSLRHHITIPLGSSTQEAERILILQTLASAGNNKAKAAKILGVSRKTLHNKLASFLQS